MQGDRSTGRSTIWIWREAATPRWIRSTRSNVATLTPRWLFQYGIIDGVSNQTTPVVVDGVMYVTDPARQRLRASTPPTDTCSGATTSPDLIGGGRREGYVFRNRGVATPTASSTRRRDRFCSRSTRKPGKPIPTFGKNGQASVILDVIRKRFPDVKAAISLGYWFTTAPQVHNGVHLHRQHAQREPHPRRPCAGGGRENRARCSGTSTRFRRTKTIRAGTSRVRPGSAASATAAASGRRRRSIPSSACSTSAVGNPFGDSTKRAGINLFTDSILALTLDTGRLKWYFQQTHHDVWDYDSGNQPILFDMQVRGPRVKALAEASKNGFLYILNRETGEPVHPIKEMPVPTEARRPGEQPWPTQPIPFTASGKMMAPVSPVTATDIPAERLATVCWRSRCSRRSAANQIQTPGQGGGANYGPLAYSPRTGLSLRERHRRSDQLGAAGQRDTFRRTTRPPASWCGRKSTKASGRPDSVVTASDLVFVGSGSNIAGYFMAFDAKSGELLWKYNTGRRSVLFAIHVYGQRRAVRRRGIGRRRPRPQGRRPDSQLRAAATLKRFSQRCSRTTVAVPHRGSANTKLGVEKHGAGNIGHCHGARPKAGLSRRRPAPRFTV